MKTNKTKSNTLFLILSFALVAFTTSCNSGSNKESTGNHAETKEGHHDEHGEDHHHEGEEGEHHHEETHQNTSGEVMWMPSGEAFSKQLKLEKGNTEELGAKVVNISGSKVLSITATEDNAVMLMEGSYNNLGVELQFKLSDYKGSLTLLFHYTDNQNYDALVLNNQSMELHRVINGKTSVLDSKQVSLPTDWANLKLSAAGEHLKGFLNGKQYNHGHAEEHGAGQVGIMLNGTGKVLLKMLTVIPLEE
ncbi:MAG: hypothetical protein ABEH43_00935 [Flavobacteriales bacterium]